MRDVCVRAARDADYGDMAGLWNGCAEAGDVVYSPLNRDTFVEKMVRPGAVMFVAEADGCVVGFAHGMVDDGDTGYVTAVMVKGAYRRRGIGAKLFAEVEGHMQRLKKRVLAVSGSNPVHLSWQVPGTDGHDHNNAPGVDDQCAGYAFAVAMGMAPFMQEVAMYRNLEGYVYPAAMEDIKKRLADEDIQVGVYDGQRTLRFDGMCDRVGSEYWRNVLRQELAAWAEGRPCADADLWTDGVEPEGPRPLLLATHGDEIVGFTGPVARQRSGRGWFTGICVDPNYGRRSIGALLFHMLLRAFVEAGATFSTLFTGAENHAQQIYLRAGFEVARTFTIMTKPLADGAAYGETHF